jgi:RHS repeat-associated protein
MWGTLAAGNTYRFSGKEYDLHSGLYYFGYRFYDPNLQRWLNSDPIGERGGLNLYGFVGNNPINDVDQLGLLDYYNSPGGFVNPSGPVPYLEGDTWYGNIGAQAYNTIPFAYNGLFGWLSDIGTGAGTAYGNGDYFGMALSGGIDASGMVPGDGAEIQLLKLCFKGKAAAKAASRLGFTKRIPPQKAPFNTHGQPLFQNGNRYITPDIDSHKGGVWKMFDINGNRLGTFDDNLKKIGN